MVTPVGSNPADGCFGYTHVGESPTPGAILNFSGVNAFFLLRVRTKNDYTELFTIRSNEKTTTQTGARGIVNDLTAATNRGDLAAFDDYYVAQRSKLLRDFDKNEKHSR